MSQNNSDLRALSRRLWTVPPASAPGFDQLTAGAAMRAADVLERVERKLDRLLEALDPEQQVVRANLDAADRLTDRIVEALRGGGFTRQHYLIAAKRAAGKYYELLRQSCTRSEFAARADEARKNLSPDDPLWRAVRIGPASTPRLREMLDAWRARAVGPDPGGSDGEPDPADARPGQAVR